MCEKFLKREYPDWIVAAVAWWGSALSNPTMEDVSIADLLEAALKFSNTSEGIKPFCNALAELMMESNQDMICLDVDYYPWGILRDALKKAGVSAIEFPWKTHMRASTKKVEVSCGSGAPSKVIWEAPKN